MSEEYLSRITEVQNAIVGIMANLPEDDGPLSSILGDASYRLRVLYSDMLEQQTA